MASLKNYIGNEFRNFKVIKDLGTRFPTKNSKQRHHFMIVKCQLCNLEREIQIESLRNKATKCECQYKPLVTKEWLRCYKIHHGMMSRCYDKDNKDYPRWGKRGIRVCREWKNNPSNFYEWSIKNGYDKILTIDRIDNNKGYSPQNCRWATREEQQQNKKCSTSIKKVRKVKELLNEDITMAEISRLVKVNYSLVKNIKYKRSWNNIT